MSIVQRTDSYIYTPSSPFSTVLARDCKFHERLAKFNLKDLEKFDKELQMEIVPHGLVKAIYRVAQDACEDFVFRHENENDYEYHIDDIKKKALRMAMLEIADHDLAKRISRNVLDKVIVST